MTDAHSRVSMGSIAYIDKGKELEKEVHRFSRFRVKLSKAKNSSMVVTCKFERGW